MGRTWRGVDSVRELRDLFWELLQNKFGDEVVLNGHPIERLPNTLNVSFAAKVGAEILRALARSGRVYRFRVPCRIGGIVPSPASHGSRT